MCGGTPNDRARIRLLRRSIPACAGEPHQSPSPAGPRTVYPRVCGGTTCPVSTRLHDVGLSPRVRGNLASKRQRGTRSGLSPRVRGNHDRQNYDIRVKPVYPRVCGGTDGYSFVETEDGVYPRVCGGNLRPSVGADAIKRSIPACAGEPICCGRACCSLGSIPACAGEPAAHRAKLYGLRVYPRVCGGTTLQAHEHPHC